MAIGPSRQLLLQNLAKSTKELILNRASRTELYTYTRHYATLGALVGAFSLIVKSSQTFV